jgi:hypothetical protein
VFSCAAEERSVTLYCVKVIIGQEVWLQLIQFTRWAISDGTRIYGRKILDASDFRGSAFVKYVNQRHWLDDN